MAEQSKKNYSKDELLTLLEKLETENSEFRKTLANHKILTDTINETFFLSDVKENKVLYVSPSYERMFGMTVESLYADPKSWSTNLHPEDKVRIRKAFDTKISENSYDEEYRIIRNDGKVEWVRDRAFPVNDENGELQYIAGITQFITKRKEADFKLKETTENLIQMLENIPVGILILNNDYETVFANKFIMNLLAISQEDIYAKNILQTIDKNFYEELKTILSGSIHINFIQTEEINFRNFINEEYWVDIKATKIHFNGQESILITLNDISNLKSAQKDLIKSRQNLYALINNSDFAQILLDNNGQILKFNSVAFELFNYLTEMYLIEKAPIVNYFNDTEFKRFGVEFKKALNDEKVVFEKEYNIQGGESLWLEERYHPAKSEDGEIFGVTYSLVNISARKKAEKELIKSKAYLQAMFNSSSGLNLYAIDKNYRYTEFNGQHAFLMHQLWNKDIEIGMSIFDAFSNQFAQDVLKLNFGRAFLGEEFTLIETLTMSEHKTYYENTYSPIFNTEGEVEGAVAIIRDITEVFNNKLKLEKSERELKELNTNKDKFLSIIAHDLKSPLNGFIGLSSELTDNIDFMERSDVKELASSMNESAKNIFQLLENLLEWTRTITGKKQLVQDNLNPYLITETLVSLFKEVAKNKNNKIVNNFDSKVYLFGDANMFTTILRNLISNSLKFTENGEVSVGMDVAGDMAQVYVRDTGTGMRAEVKDKLFKIDQSISEVGTRNETGTGLGLILCKEFVEKNGGTIWVESELGKGTTFYFTFPLVN